MDPDETPKIIFLGLVDCYEVVSGQELLITIRIASAGGIRLVSVVLQDIQKVETLNSWILNLN